MSIQEIINSKINRLISIRLTNGVQPEDLASNIYLEDYKKLSFYKVENKVIGEITFKEEIKGMQVDTTLRYIYSENKVLLRIEEQINDRIKIEWDREIIENELVNDVIDLLKSEYSNTEIQCFINTLPEDLKSRIESACCRVA